MSADICEKSKNVIKRNITNYVDSNPLTNELSERIFRMANEKIPHCKSMITLEQTLIQYFNDPSARLN